MQKIQKNYKSFGTTMFTNSKNYSNKTHKYPATGHAYNVHTTQSTNAGGRAGGVATMSYHVPLGFLDLLLEPGVLAPVVNRHADLPDTQRQQTQQDDQENYQPKCYAIG